MSGLIWSIVLSAVGLVGVYLTGKYNSWGWAVGLFAQVPWITYALTTAQYGFLISAAVFGTIYATTWAKWRRNERRPECRCIICGDRIP